MLAETTFPERTRVPDGLAASVNSDFLKSHKLTSPYAGNSLYRQLAQEFGHGIRIENRETVRFMHVRSDLGQKFDRGQPDGAGQAARFRQNPLLEGSGHFFHGSKQAFKSSGIQIGLTTEAASPGGQACNMDHDSTEILTYGAYVQA